MAIANEEKFIKYWEENRNLLNTTTSKFLRGLPVAILFTLPIIALLVVVYIFSPEWYTKVAPKDPGTFTIIFIALFISILFIAYFRMQFKWEENEQAYQDYLYRQEKKQRNDPSPTL